MSNNCQTIVFSDKAYNAIVNESFRKDPFETGGILLGHILDNGIWIVMEVLPPGWNSIFQFAYFEYDERFVNYLAQSVASEYKNELSLLGLWHRHPGSMDTFSGTDDETNSVFAELNPKGAISGLVNVDPNFRLTMYHVSYPLQYDEVEIAVGDDLIPEEYFLWKHFPEKGLNPSWEKQKRNSATKTFSNNYRRIDALKYEETPKKKLQRIFHSKSLFTLIGLACLLLASILGYSYLRLKNTDDVKIPYQLMGLGDIEFETAQLDSLTKVYTAEFDKKYIAPSEQELLKTQRDSLLKDRFMTHNMRGVTVDSVGIRDSLEMTYFDKISLEYKTKQQNKEISKQLDIQKEKISNSKSNDYNRAVKYSFLALFVLAILAIINAFLPSKLSFERAWIYTAVAFVVTILVFLIVLAFKVIPQFTYNGIVYFNVYYVCLSVFVLLSLITLFILPLFVKKYWNKRQLTDAKLQKRSKYWFQVDTDLYMEESHAITTAYPETEQSIDEGVLSFVVKYRTGRLWIVQLAYDKHYNKEQGSLRAYIISPDLKDIIFRARVDLPYVCIDEAGEPYVDVSRELTDDKMNGLSALSNAFNWINCFEKWNSGLIGLVDFKLN